MTMLRTPWLATISIGLVLLASACSPGPMPGSSGSGETPGLVAATGTRTPAPSDNRPASRPTPTPSLDGSKSQPTATWRGLTVAPEDRCSEYDPDDYSYPQSVEPRIVAQMGDIIYGPYTGRWFSSTRETDIEHIVARSEAHDSGLCGAGPATRRRFASDLLNLTLASPQINRSQKVAKDGAEWLPAVNRCWFADRAVRVRREYGLTIDRREVDALEAVLSGCSSVEMVVVPASAQPTVTPTSGTSSSVDALAMWDDDGNGRITSREARNHGIAPVHRDHPAYPYMTDGDGDGVVCE